MNCSAIKFYADLYVVYPGHFCSFSQGGTLFYSLAASLFYYFVFRNKENSEIVAETITQGTKATKD